MKTCGNILTIFIMVLLVPLSGCHNRQKGIAADQELIPREQMIKLLADVELTEAALKKQQVKLSHDSTKIIAQQSYDSLYAWYGVSHEQFQENLRYYQQDMEDFQVMMDSVIITLSRHKDSIPIFIKLQDTTKVKQ